MSILTRKVTLQKFVRYVSLQKNGDNQLIAENILHNVGI